MNNYHTHTFRCKHASGDVADYLAEARRAGLEELGFSDHAPLPDGRWPEVRMGMAELPGYLAAVREAGRTEDARPAGESRIRVLAALECEWSPAYDSYLRDELLGELGLDYLVSGSHSYLNGGEWRDSYAIRDAAGLAAYAAHVARSLETGLFAFVAHPDLYCVAYLPWDEKARACGRDILAAASAAGVPLEINGYGMRKPWVSAPEGRRPPYPHEGFWELAAEYDVGVVVNSDAHRPADVAANLAEGRAMAARFGLRLVENPVAAARPLAR